MNQSVFELSLPTSYHTQDFVVTGSNQLAYEQVMRFDAQPNNAMLLLGPTASGKTHLSHIWAEQNNAHFIPHEALATAQSATHFNNHSAIVVEDIEQCEATPLFHLLQHLKHTPHHTALFNSSKNLNTLWLQPADIHSRLKALPIAQLNEPDDSLLEALFIKGFSDRQLRIDPALIAYLLPRVERSCVAVYQLLQQLDLAALQEKRSITLPLARSVLEKVQ